MSASERRFWPRVLLRPAAAGRLSFKTRTSRSSFWRGELGGLTLLRPYGEPRNALKYSSRVKDRA